MSTQNINPPISNTPSGSINGRNPVASGIPMNGNTSFSNDHKRTPSMTVTPAGTTSFNPTGPPQNKANLQFGSLNNGGNVGSSPAMSTPQPAHTQSNSLGVNNLAPRMPTPSNSPSPIPQPSQAVGGKPPSDVSAPGKNMSFGQFGNDGADVNGMNRSFSQMQMHDRRGSQHSVNMGHDVPAGPGRGGYSNRGGRGGYGGNQYGNHMPYNPQNNFRPNNGRGGYPNRGGHNMPYQGSPSLQNRQPMMNSPTPQMAAMQMNMPGMQYGGYQSYPAAYGQVPIAADPSISYNAQYQQYYPQQYQGYPPQSPRPPFNQPGYGGQQMQQQYSNQGQMPQPMSRQSSQMSTADRPASSIGPTPQTPAATLHHTSARTPSVSGEKSSFIPPKKSSAIVIKNANGEVVDFSKKASSAAAPAPVATPVIPTPPSRTGSAVSATHSRNDSQSVKPEQNSDDKKKAMQEAVARKIAQEKADKEEEVEKLRKAKQAEEEKAEMEAEAAAAAQKEAEAKKAEAERLEKEAAEAKEAEEEAKAAAEEKAQADAREAEAARAAEAEEAAKAAEEEKNNKPAALTEDEEFERMAAEYEREAAEKEAEEARKEEEYNKKKAAQKEALAKKQQEEVAAYEATMKEAERKAEEEELAREKKRAEGATSDDESKKMFAQLKAGETGDAAESTEADEASPVATPGESGVATPLSDISMGPPAKAGSARKGKPSELTLNTKGTAEPPEPSATLKSLNSARKLEDPAKISYPEGIVSPNPALNASAPADRKFKYNKEFLLQFQTVFKEKPSLDWDQKIAQALGTDESGRSQTARTPSGMGGRSASSRGPAGGFNGPMGAFGGGPARTLPPGTTSEQRYAASQGATRAGPGPMGANPFANFGRGQMGPPMARTPSNNPMGLPGSPRVGGGASRGGSRAESKRNKQSHKQDHAQDKSMPLTAGLNVGSLEVSSTGWKPRSVGQATGPQGPGLGSDGYMEADVVQRKVKAALNKMTPENFERISDQVLTIAAQSKSESDGRTLRQVIQLVFEKATDEAHWAPMYAQFCFKMLSTMSAEIKDEGIKDKNGNVVAGGNLFRKYLLNRCQEEFEKGWKINLPGKKEGESEEAVMLSDEYYIAAAAKRRGLGLVRFIGELFKLGMLTERIMHECVKKLLDFEGLPEEAEVESLSSLLRTIGKQLDSPESKAAPRMDAYFERIIQTMNLPDLPSRLRFMLLDIVDLRRAGWNSKDADKGPKTIQQIHEEAEAAAQRAEVARLQQQASGRGGGRMPMGRGDARSFSTGPLPPPDTSNRVGVDDLRRLGGRLGATRQTMTPSGSFGPSALGARTNSRRGLGPSMASTGTSRTGTPPAQADANKDESSTNAFSALAALEGGDGPASPPSNPSSPPT